MPVDVSITDTLVLTVDERNRLYERGTVLVDDGRITRFDRPRAAIERSKPRTPSMGTEDW